MKTVNLILFFILIFCVNTVYAKDEWKLHGFASQNGIYSTDNFMLGRTDDNFSLDYRELALILHGGVTDNFTFSSQLMSRKAGVSDNGDPKIDYAFFNWRFYDSASTMQSFTVGRVKVPIGLYNDLRESPFTRSGVFLPQSMYPDRSRNSMMSADELVLVDEFRNEDWSVNLAAGVGNGRADEKEAVDNFDVTLDPKDLNTINAKRWNLRILTDYQEGRIRFAYSRFAIPSEFNALYRPAPGINVAINGEVYGIWDMLSAEYNHEKYSIISEYYRAIVKFRGFQLDPSNPDYRNVPQGGYIQLGYRYDAKIDFFVRYDTAVFDNDDPNGKYYSKLFPNILNYARFASDRVFGISYRPSPAWLFRFDFHNIDGSLWMTKRDAPVNYVPQRYWNMLALSASWRF